MKLKNSFKSDIFNITQETFDVLALRLFRVQAKENEIYRRYLSALNFMPESVNNVDDIPFLPIRFFKDHIVKTGIFQEEAIFRSSGTTGIRTSCHYIESLDYYKQVTEHVFKYFYGDIRQYVIIGLLPSYLDRKDASLVHMVQHYINLSKSQDSGFYLNDYEALVRKLKELNQTGKKVWLIGVTFALLEFAERYRVPLENTIIVETGGMKGRGRELTRPELHKRLKNQFSGVIIHSEYGMTELHSQAYMQKNRWFQAPGWMKVYIRDINDPFAVLPDGKNGAINIIDLANVNSCAFIETQDIGVRDSAGRFQVLGRMDNTEQRGCNLMLY